MDRAIKELVELSTYAGDRPRFVQGGGGNCSVKFSGKMAVKASGFFLEDVTEKNGFVVVPLASDAADVSPAALKSSLETNLHRLFGAYVIHTHPIVVGALISAEEGQAAARELFAGTFYGWVPYAAPGAHLFERVKAEIRGLATPAQGEWILFLQNHGLLVAAGLKDRCMELHEQTVRKLEIFFDYHEPMDLAEVPAGRYLTPDHVVYGDGETKALSAKQKIAAGDTAVFAGQVLELIKKKKWHPRWLADADVDFLRGMKGEAYRKKIGDAPP